MTIELFLQAIFQVATVIVLTTWAVVGVVVSTYYAFSVAHSLITRRDKYARRLKKSRLFSLYDRGEKKWAGREIQSAKSK